MTADERQQRLAELKRWLTEICDVVRDEASRLASEATQNRAQDRIWGNLSSKLDVAAKILFSLEKKTNEFLERKLQSKQDLSRYFKAAIFRETRLRPRQERGRAQARKDKLEQNSAEFQREPEDVQRERLQSAREIYDQHVEFCLQRLNERDRRILLAVERDGDTIEEVARREEPGYDAMAEEDQKRAYDKIKTALSRARRKVRQCMIERGVKIGDIP